MARHRPRVTVLGAVQHRTRGLHERIVSNVLWELGIDIVDRFTDRCQLALQVERIAGRVQQYHHEISLHWTPDRVRRDGYWRVSTVASACERESINRASTARKTSAPPSQSNEATIASHGVP